MSGQEGLAVFQRCVTSSDGCAPAEERIDWEDFFLTHDPMIRHVVADYAARRADVEDLHQEVRKELARKLPGFRSLTRPSRQRSPAGY